MLCLSAEGYLGLAKGGDLKIMNISSHAFHTTSAAQKRIRRHVTLILGPTNSGKTYRAMQMLAKAATRIYLAPSRTLAMEVAETLNNRGIPCNLMTGDQLLTMERARHTACTIEMLPLGNQYDVCVIDEAQMLADPDRGWAWTQAILGVQAKEVNIVATPEARPAIEKLLGLTGDPFQVMHFSRVSSLQFMDEPVNDAQELQSGTAIIAFSRKAALSLKTKIEQQTDTQAAVLYAELPPEVQRQQARLFASGEAPFLVATDVIEMGVNLPIRTILFAQEQALTPMQVRQIAGQAGRFGKKEVGFVGTFQITQERIKDAFQMKPDPILRAHLAPTLKQLMAIATLKKEEHPSLAQLLSNFTQPDLAVYELADMKNQIALAHIVDRFKTLDLPTRFILSSAPVSLRQNAVVTAFEFMATSLAHNQVLSLGKIMPIDLSKRKGGLEFMEISMQIVTLYCWLHFRFPRYFPEQGKAETRRENINQTIKMLLEWGNQLERYCAACGGILPQSYLNPVCDVCLPTTINVTKQKNNIEESALLAQATIKFSPQLLSNRSVEKDRSSGSRIIEITKQRSQETKIPEIDPPLGINIQWPPLAPETNNQMPPLKASAIDLLLKLSFNHPDLFPSDSTIPKPWIDGIQQQIQTKYRVSKQVTQLAIDMYLWKHKIQYSKALASSGERYDLNGLVQLSIPCVI